MEMNIDSVVAACGVATVVVNVAGMAALMIYDGVKDVVQIWRRLRK